MIGRTKASVAALAASVLVLAALYGTLGGQGNEADASCAATEPAAAALNPLAEGEVAAFQVARQPVDLSALAFNDANGQPTTLDGFQGKVALVNIWATWCAPCRREMPALDRLQAAMGGDDFAVVPVSIDTGDPARAKEFLDQIAVRNLPLYTDPTTKIFDALKTRGLALGLPVTVLLDRQGCHLGHMNGPAEWDSEDGRRLIEAAIGTAAQS